jgi:hypothetical protein
MKKFLLIIIIFVSVMMVQNYLQNYYNKSIIKSNNSGKSYAVEAYLLDWDENFLYFSSEEDKEFKFKVSDNTQFFRTYINEQGVLYGQEVIGLEDFFKEQFVSADIFRNSKLEIPEVLILRQLVYVSEN